MWFTAVTEFLCVSSKIKWVKSKFQSIKTCAVLQYDRTEDDIDRETYVTVLVWVLNIVGNGCRLFGIGELCG